MTSLTWTLPLKDEPSRLIEIPSNPRKRKYEQRVSKPEPRDELLKEQAEIRLMRVKQRKLQNNIQLELENQ